MLLHQRLRDCQPETEATLPRAAVTRAEAIEQIRFQGWIDSLPVIGGAAQGRRRLAKPLQLAEELLRNQGWKMEKVESAAARSSPQTVNLDKSVPVHILYWTAWVDGSETVQFRRDIYARDGTVARALRQQPR